MLITSPELTKKSYFTSKHYYIDVYTHITLFSQRINPIYLQQFPQTALNTNLFPLAPCDRYIILYIIFIFFSTRKPQLSLPGTTQVPARIIQNLMFSMPIPPVPAPLWLNSLSGLVLCVLLSTLGTGEQLQVCEPGSSQVSIYATNRARTPPTLSRFVCAVLTPCATFSSSRRPLSVRSRAAVLFKLGGDKAA